MSDEAHHHPNYTKVYYWLVALAFVSFVGPEITENRAIILLTAFGIAVVKAWLVVVNFMHLTIAPRYVTYLMGTTLIFVLLFFAAAAPDVMKADGSNWVKSPETWNPPLTEDASAGHH